ncbi:MAG: hypothetical protein CM15mP66_00700 [Pseudomonadota bacterium]|nr:MAG: hypothetical protein CM15mP66_00700 [Pseudomonadota bacterium]
MPSKLLIAAAEAAHGMEIAPGFGIHPGSISIDGEAVMERVRRERDRFVGFVLDGVDRIDPEQKISGQARFVEDFRLEIGNSQVRAGRVVIASGTSPAIPTFSKKYGTGYRSTMMYLNGKPCRNRWRFSARE